MMGAFGTSSRADRKRRRAAGNWGKDIRKNGDKVHDRRWMMIVVAVIVVVALVWLHVI
jgi:hypothetical protein